MSRFSFETSGHIASSENRKPRTMLGKSASEDLSLEPRDTRSLVLAAIAVAADVRLGTSDERVMLDRLARVLELRRALVVVDGVDAHLELVAGVVADLIDAPESVGVLAAAWQALALPFERVMHIDPLSTEAAIHLLTDRVRRLALHRSVAADQAEALVVRAGRLPLAVELVAARVASLGAAAILDAREPAGLALDALDRAIDAAWTQLTDPDRRALIAVSVFRGAFTAQAAAEVIGEPDALSSLARLCDRSLIQSLIQSGRDDTLVLLASIRDHITRRAEARTARAAVEARHAAVPSRRSASSRSARARPPSPNRRSGAA